MKKAWIIVFFFLSLQSCGSYEIVTLNHRPAKQVKVIVVHDYQSHWDYPLTRTHWRYRYINPYIVPRVRTVRPIRTQVKIKGSRGGSSIRTKSTERRND
jgi:hypothetical protein